MRWPIAAAMSHQPSPALSLTMLLALRNGAHSIGRRSCASVGILGLACVLIAIPLLAACGRTFQYAVPSAGATSGVVDGDRYIHGMSIGGGSTVSAWIEQGPGGLRLVYQLVVKNSGIELTQQMVTVRCVGMDAVDAPITHVSGSGVRNGSVASAELPWQTQLVGSGRELPDGTISDGRYWIDASIPSCARPKYEVYLPALSGAGVILPKNPLTFRREQGGFVLSPGAT